MTTNMVNVQGTKSKMKQSRLQIETPPQTVHHLWIYYEKNKSMRYGGMVEHDR
eukprot:m.213447 g.213447  ORF g.213447 m.213447 type:complete len:53 (-) comp19056_c0_seq2:1306-1464(-)